MTTKKQEIITFKVDQVLYEALQGIENRSDFIRSAILAALDSICPLCKGSGVMTPQQREHWSAFEASHSLQVCDQCDAVHLVCGKSKQGLAH